MNRSRVTQLGYLGMEVSDMAAWKPFANEVLGLQPNGSGADGALLLKMDEYHHRVALHPGARDDIAYAGWETPDAAAMQAVAARLQSQGAARERGHPRASERAPRRGADQGRRPERRHQRGLLGPADRDRSGLPFTARRMGGFEAGGTSASATSCSRWTTTRRACASTATASACGSATSSSSTWGLLGGPRSRSCTAAHVTTRSRSRSLRRPGACTTSCCSCAMMDDVGSTFDLCQDRRIPIASSLGHHTNDLMTSFYMVTPSGFQVEYGHGGREIDDEYGTCSSTMRRACGGIARRRRRRCSKGCSRLEAAPARGRGRAHAAARRNQLTSSTAAATDRASTIQVVITLREALSRNRRRSVGQYEGRLNMGWCCRRSRSGGVHAMQETTPPRRAITDRGGAGAMPRHRAGCARWAQARLALLGALVIEPVTAA